MFYPHQPSYTPLSSFYSLQAHAPDPNSTLSYSQPSLPSALASELVLHPPGINPYPSSTSYLPSLSVFEAQTAYYQDTVAVSESWVVKQADPIGYPVANNSLIEKSIVSTSLNSLRSNNWANDASKKTPKQTKVIQSMRCEVCNIDCNSKDVFDKHILGKKHKRNLQMQNAPPTIFKKRSLPGVIGAVGGQMISGASGVAVGEDLETKKRKLEDSGAAVDSVRVCTICNVVCNSQEVFSRHLSGKKHAAQAGIGLVNGNQPFVAANLNPISWIVSTAQPHGKGMKKKGTKKTQVVQSAWCEVCKIQCNSNDVFGNHIQGKKHQKNLEKLKKSKQDNSGPTTTAANPIIGPVENPEANKASGMKKSTKKAGQSVAPEDLETKKRKVMEGGAAPGAVRVCSLCNVVCNSQTVFTFHLAGQKHAAMVNKLADTGMATAGPQVSASV